MFEGQGNFDLEEGLAHIPLYTGGSDIRYLVKWVGYDYYGPHYNSWGRRLKQRAIEAVSDYWDEVAVVQAQSRHSKTS